MEQRDTQDLLRGGKVGLGIELGSTRIKACAVLPDGRQIAQGVFAWENHFKDGHWTYPLASVWEGIAGAYAMLAGECERKFGVRPQRFVAIGISAMMHGYLAFDKNDQLLVPFRTWRDTTTGRAAQKLTGLFGVTVPLRWSISHYYQALLDKEEHVDRVAFLTTLAGYVHWRLTGEKVLGVGDASGMFPITGSEDAGKADRPGYDRRCLGLFEDATGVDVAGLLPRVLVAGEVAGVLTAEGARLLDPSGVLQPGIRFAPPEGDAGTGMVATNAVRPRTGNVSVGTSIFLMAVLEQALTSAHPEIDPVTTPVGDPVAMVHCNNGADELARWVELFAQVARKLDAPNASLDAVYAAVLSAALEGETDAGGVLAFNNLAGEPIVRLDEGRPVVTRSPGAALTLGNFMRAQVYSTFAALALGLRVLDGENAGLDVLCAHGGVFRTKLVMQRLLAAATGTPITVREGAAEGGAWGMALLALFTARGGGNLADFLDEEIFASSTASTIAPARAEVEGFARFLGLYEKGLPIVGTAVGNLPAWMPASEDDLVVDKEGDLS
ncbi:xylulokinase [Actinotignum sp. GS-2025f]|uniref:xylulokinase n=1 Tax=Actinotignum TaxID=1653174 RepID=UPI002A81922B|nr:MULTISPECIES: FGGY-family carbohydrate kinase [Actinotignum]MDY5127828.1 FGGY-family carbohydrate kinase [Actinotignum sp. SLA_B059]MDY5156099.1 FGGY-family carbohydrate kinase [Actinotignum timonense]